MLSWMREAGPTNSRSYTVIHSLTTPSTLLGMISHFLDQNMKRCYLENGKAAEAGSEVMPVGG